MKWVALCIKNKLIIYVMALAICALGIFCIYLSPIAPFPKISFGNLRVQISYPGASASAVQTQVTNKIVNSLKSTSNIQQIRAISQPGNAMLNLHLNNTSPTDMLKTQLNVMQAISSSHLPQSVPMPTITQNTGTSSIVTFIISSKTMSLFQIANFIQARMYPKFSSMPGVSLFYFSGNPTVKIKLNPEAITKYGLKTIQVSSLINAAFKAQPMGSLDLGNQAYTLGIKNNIQSLNGFRNLVVGYSGETGFPIYLKDIATISFEPQSLVSNDYSSFNGQVANGITLYTRGFSNPFTVWSEAKAYVQKLNKNLPPNTKITPIFNNAKTMKNAVEEVIWTIIIASILVLVIALVFLGHLKTTLIPIVTIPICLLGSIVVVYSLGYSINMITLLALVVAVGLVVDDAIVVVENVTRYLEMGMKKHDAVIQGTHDIATTIIGITLVLMAVYIPITFCSGSFIELLKAFAIPLSAAVFISGILALTLSPLLSIVLLQKKQTNYQIKFNAILAKTIAFYHRMLKVVLGAPKIALVCIICAIIAAGYVDLKLPQEFFPMDPDGQINIITQDGGTSNIALLKQRTKQFKQFYDSPKVAYYSVDIMPDPATGRTQTRLAILYKKQYLHQVVGFADQINQFIKSHNIPNTEAQADKFSNANSGGDLAVIIYGPQSVAAVNNSATELTDLMKKMPTFSTVYNSINKPHKQLQFKLDTVKAARVGIYQPQIMALLGVDYGGFTLNNYFNIDGLTVPVLVQLNSHNLKTEKSLQNITIQSDVTGKTYPLSEFVSLETVAKPGQITTFNGQPSVEIDANLAKGKSLGIAIKKVDALIAKNMPDMQYVYTGNAEQFLKGNSQSIMIVILGIACIYCLLVILFRSLLDPFIIMLTVPFTVVGGAASLYLVGGTINLYSTLALITLIGLITKHGVLIVQFANQELAKGKTVREAIMASSKHRFRPIIMTTLAMTLGALPLVFSYDKLFVAKQDLGIVIIGGLVIGTLFSLFIVPVVYSLIKC